VARRFELGPHIRFGQEIREAVFDETRGRWRLRSATGEAHDATVLVSA
jgi:cation diffusion facilitator CzcD-associated flavoprotein CzcO